MTQQINILFDDGGLGDNIARLPVIPYILEYYPFHINLFLHDYFIPVAANALRHYLDRVTLIKWSERHQHYNPQLITKSFAHAAFQNLSMHMTEHAFAVVCNTLPEDPRWYNYPKLDLSAIALNKFNLPTSYIIVTTAFTAPVREFLPEHVNAIVKHLKARGKEVVFLGQKATPTGTKHVIEGNIASEIDFSQGLDLIDKTTLLEAAKILSQAGCVVGLDNGLIHLAACSDVPVICGFTTVKPEHRAPYRQDKKSWNFFPVVPPQSLDCRFCQSVGVFDMGIDFRYCKLGTTECTKVTGAELYIKEIEKVLK